MVNNKSFESINIIVIIVFEIFIVGLSIYPIFHINETQIMYISSTGAQVIAALFGLIITGYIFFNSRLDIETEKDETLYDITLLLKKRYNKRIVLIGIYSFLAILFCMFNIILGTQNILIYLTVNNILLNNSIFFILLTVFYIVIFVFDVIDPNKIEKESSKARIEFNNDKEKGDLAVFLKMYNDIERMIKDTVEKVMGGNVYSNSAIIKQINILFEREIINRNLVSELNNLRKYRNFVVHGSEMVVSKKVVDNTVQLKKLLTDAIYTYHQTKSEK